MRTLSFPPDPPAELKDALADFGTLQRIWFNYKSPCSKENCPICQSKSDKKRGQEDDKDDKDDKENGEDEDENEDEEDEEEEDDSNEEDSEEDEEGNKDVSSSRKSRKRKSKKQQDSTSTGLQDVNVAKKSTRASKHRKFLMGDQGERLDDFGSLRRVSSIQPSLRVHLGRHNVQRTDADVADVSESRS